MIKIEYIVESRKGVELRRFNVKTEAEIYDSVVNAAEDISLLLEPLQKKLSLSEEQIYSISEHLAYESDALKLALKQIKKPKTPSQDFTKESTDEPPAATPKVSKKKAVKKTNNGSK